MRIPIRYSSFIRNLKIGQSYGCSFPEERNNDGDSDRMGGVDAFIKSLNDEEKVRFAGFVSLPILRKPSFSIAANGALSEGGDGDSD